MEPSFEERLHAQAEKIRNGCLDRGEKYPEVKRVHKSSWNLLADINDLGMLTWTSQDALHWRTGMTNPGERAYVRGYMQTDLARRFISDFNLRSDSTVARPLVTLREIAGISIETWELRPESLTERRVGGRFQEM